MERYIRRKPSPEKAPRRGSTKVRKSKNRQDGRSSDNSCGSSRSTFQEVEWEDEKNEDVEVAVEVCCGYCMEFNGLDVLDN